MEIVAMDMKLRGIYIARQLSFLGVTFNIEEIPLSPAFVSTYNESVALVSYSIDKICTKGPSKGLIVDKCVITKNICRMFVHIWYSLCNIFFHIKHHDVYPVVKSSFENLHICILSSMLWNFDGKMIILFSIN